MTIQREAESSQQRPSSTRIGRPLGFERAVTSIIGIIAVLAGVATLLVAAGVFGVYRARRPILDPLFVRWLQDHPAAAIAAAVGLGIFLLLIGLWWLTHALRTEPRPDIRLERGPSGDTVVTSSALSDALRDEAREIEGVSRVRVRMAGSPRQPNIRLVLSLHEGTDLRRIWEELDNTVLSKAREALEAEVLATAIRIELDQGNGQRVR